VTFEITLHAVAERGSRDLDDALARDASEFDTLPELRADVERVLRERLEASAQGRYRAEVLAAVGRATQVSLPDAAVDDRVEDLLLSLAQSFERRGVSLGRWLASTGQTPEQVRAELRPEAVATLRQEIGLRALADREGIEVDDERLRELVREDAAGEEEPDAVVEEVLASGAKESLREDFRLRLALDRAVELATPITPEQAAAREQLWTPEKDAAAAPETPKPALWTPGSPR
jgi:trigger factor